MGSSSTRLSELSAKNSEASEPYSHDDAQGHQDPREDEDIEKQLGHEHGLD